MATRIYGLSLGEKHFQVTEGVGSATTDHAELTIDLAQVDTREQAIILIDKIKAYILEDVWPPA